MSPTVEVKDAYGNRVTSQRVIASPVGIRGPFLPASYRFTSGTGSTNGITPFTNGVR